MDKILSCFSAALFSIFSVMVVFCIFLFVSGLQCEAELIKLPIATDSSEDYARIDTDTGEIFGKFNGLKTTATQSLEWEIDGQWVAGSYVTPPTHVQFVDSFGNIKIEFHYPQRFQNHVASPTAEQSTEPTRVSILHAQFHFDSIADASARGLAVNRESQTWIFGSKSLGRIWVSDNTGEPIYNGAYSYQFDYENIRGHLRLTVDYDNDTKLTRLIDPENTFQDGVDGYDNTYDGSVYVDDVNRAEHADGAEIRGSGTGTTKYGFITFDNLNAGGVANGTYTAGTNTLRLNCQTATATGNVSLYLGVQENPFFNDLETTTSPPPDDGAYNSYANAAYRAAGDVRYQGGGNIDLSQDLAPHDTPLDTVNITGTGNFDFDVSGVEIYGSSGTVCFWLVADTNVNVSFDAQNGSNPPILTITTPSVSGLQGYATNTVNSNNTADIFRTVETRFVTEQIFTINEDDYTPSDDFTPHVTMSVQYRDEYLTTELTGITQERTISNSTPAIAFSTTLPATPGAMVLSASVSTETGDYLFQKNITLLSGGGSADNSAVLSAIDEHKKISLNTNNRVSGIADATTPIINRVNSSAFIAQGSQAVVVTGHAPSDWYGLDLGIKVFRGSTETTAYNTPTHSYNAPGLANNSIQFGTSNDVNRQLLNIQIIMDATNTAGVYSVRTFQYNAVSDATWEFDAGTITYTATTALNLSDSDSSNLIAGTSRVVETQSWIMLSTNYMVNGDEHPSHSNIYLPSGEVGLISQKWEDVSGNTGWDFFTPIYNFVTGAPAGQIKITTPGIDGGVINSLRDVYTAVPLYFETIENASKGNFLTNPSQN